MLLEKQKRTHSQHRVRFLRMIGIEISNPNLAINNEQEGELWGKPGR